MSFRAFSHVHTVASGDADVTHARVKGEAERLGVRIVLVTEHREALDDRGIAVAADRCRELSDHRVLLVPGLEIASAERWHVLAFGLDRAVPTGPAAELADRIRDAGGVPVLAHPSRYATGWEASLARIGAVEIWNRHYDGRLAPDPGALAAWRRAEGVRATFGLDAHGAEAYSGTLPEMTISCGSATEGDVMEALRAGRFGLALGGRSWDPRHASPLRRWLGDGYRRARRAARRLSRILPISERTRRRVGRKW